MPPSFSTRLTAVLLMVAAVFVNTRATAQPAAEEPPARTFLVYLGEAGLDVTVNGADVGQTDENGALRIVRTVMAGEPLRFAVDTAGWELKAQRVVPADDPSIPVLWDLTAELRSLPSPPPEVSPETNPCSAGRSLVCRQYRWSRFERAVRQGDCSAATAAIDALTTDFPEMLEAAETFSAFAEVRVECSQRTSDAATLRQALDQAAAFGDGELWCSGPGSRILARGYEALGDLPAAADGAKRAGEVCGNAPSALEWEFYFRLKLDERERAAEIIQQSPERLALFLNAWLALDRGECADRPVELDPESGDLPCHGLPQGFCARQYGRILVTCGSQREDFVTAALYLRASLPIEPARWEELDAAGRRVVALLAEAEARSERFEEAARLYELLGTLEAPTLDLRQRRAEALLLAGDETSQRQALTAYEEILPDVFDEASARAIVMNNICVLRARLATSSGQGLGDDDLAALEAAINALPQEAGGLGLVLRHSLLTLRIQHLELEEGMDNAEKLVQLQELRASFEAYREGIRRQHTAAGAGIVEGQFAIALPEVEEEP